MLASKLLSAIGSNEEPLYSDSCFSTYLYTGNGATQTINNGIDLAGKGGMVWLKDRGAGSNHFLMDSVRSSFDAALISNTAGAAGSTGYIDPTSSGFSLTSASLNTASANYASWTFRKAPKFFDVVTYTGNGANRTIPHSLGSVPGMILVKRTDTTGSWMVYHNSIGNTENLVLNTTAAKSTNATAWNSTTATASVFSLGTHADVNTNAGTYVAYLFAHDPSADGIIQCGSYVGNGSANGPEINLGWEPQYVLAKSATSGTHWMIFDAMRGIPTGGNDSVLLANLSGAEVNDSDSLNLTSNGFAPKGTGNANVAGQTYIYLAIRRPNKPPTSGTEVYNAIARTGTGAAATITGVGFAPDLVFGRGRTSGTLIPAWVDKLRGRTSVVYSDRTNAESSGPTSTQDLTSFDNDGFSLGLANFTGFNFSGSAAILYALRRAPGFMDVVCYTGTGVARTVPHSLGVAPELMIVKSRANGGWSAYAAPTGNNKILQPNTTDAAITFGCWGNTTPTTTGFSVGADGFNVNNPAVNYVWYGFSSLPGISKVGSYTGNGTTQTINCGFTTGSRFILIKRTDSTGNWIVADSTRGILSGADPALYLNSTAAEVTGVDWVDPNIVGFDIIQEGTMNANVNGASYIFLAIA